MLAGLAGWVHVVRLEPREALGFGGGPLGLDQIDNPSSHVPCGEVHESSLTTLAAPIGGRCPVAEKGLAAPQPLASISMWAPT